MSRGVSTINATITAAADGWRLDRALAEAVPTLSRERLKVLIASGAVRDAGGTQMRDPAKKAAADATFAIEIPVPASPHNEAQDIPLVVAFEDEHLIVIDKPAGLVVHPAAGNLDGTLVNALLHHCGGSAFGHRRRRAAGDRPPDRQGYVGPDGGGQDRPRACRPGQAVRRSLDRPALQGDRQRAGRCRLRARSMRRWRDRRATGRRSRSCPSRTSAR